MLNPSSFPLPLFNSIPLLNPSSSLPLPRNYRSSASTVIQNSNRYGNENEKQSKQSRAVESKSKIIGHNSMHEQIEWFDRMNCWQTIIKICISWVALFPLLLCNINGWIMQLLLCSFSGLFISLHQNVFNKQLIKCGNILLFCITLLLSNYLMQAILHLINPTVAHILSARSFTFIPSTILTILLSLLYTAKPLLLPIGYKTYLQSIRQYFSNLKQLLINVYHIRWALIRTYAILFLLSYIIVVFIFNDQIQFNGRSFYTLLHPIIFITQLSTFCIILIYSHLIAYFIMQPIFWLTLNKLYSKINNSTTLPLLLQLLRATSSQKISLQINKQGLQTSYNIFSKQQTRKQNNLDRCKYQNIIKHSLAWIMQLIISKTNNKLTNKVHIYSTNLAQINQIKQNVSYWDLLCKFINQQLNTVIEELCFFNKNVNQLNMFKNMQKSVLKDLFYECKVVRKQIDLDYQAIKLIRYLNICDYIFQTLAMADINLTLASGASVGIMSKIQEINKLADTLGGVFWLNKVILNKMGKIYNKTNRIIKKNAV